MVSNESLLSPTFLADPAQCLYSGFYLFFNIIISWDATPCSPVEVHRRFGGTYCPHPQGAKVNQARSKLQATFLASSSTLKMEAVYYFDSSVNFYHARRHCISEDTVISIVTAVRTPNPVVLTLPIRFLIFRRIVVFLLAVCLHLSLIRVFRKRILFLIAVDRGAESTDWGCRVEKGSNTL
jgi:hypothetical protein